MFKTPNLNTSEKMKMDEIFYVRVTQEKKYTKNFGTR